MNNVTNKQANLDIENERPIILTKTLESECESNPELSSDTSSADDSVNNSDDDFHSVSDEDENADTTNSANRTRITFHTSQFGKKAINDMRKEMKEGFDESKAQREDLKSELSKMSKELQEMRNEMERKEKSWTEEKIY
ncbi:hypothetical protein HHI36_004502 [Cryptolaemus montrouzieri]|uniref:Uncharacterized protein n=1 Tax=Cryptolaemus montrouzieri TaxID=559131 RepID=A0ABD2NS19_9CUCU